MRNCFYLRMSIFLLWETPESTLPAGIKHVYANEPCQRGDAPSLSAIKHLCMTQCSNALACPGESTVMGCYFLELMLFQRKHYEYILFSPKPSQ